MCYHLAYSCTRSDSCSGYAQTLWSLKKRVPSMGFLSVKPVAQGMGFGHCRKLKLLAIRDVGFTALMLFWVSACVHALNLHQMEVSLFHLHRVLT